MWQPELLAKVYAAMRKGGVLTTYCAKGAVRRMLAEIGFSVERIPGPPNGKREILRATK
jgi:tRNA U34 5-methylaminomethyl-2-thiouridine-forming methyltransferase MnmC